MSIKFIASSIVIICASLVFLLIGTKDYAPIDSHVSLSNITNETQEEFKKVFEGNYTTFFDIAVLKNGKTFVTGFNDKDSKLLYFSEDSERWTTQLLPLGLAKEISFIDAENGWIVGSGSVLKTEDGGMTWTKLSHVTDSDLNQVSFVNSKFGLVAGSVKRGCQIYLTEDGGKSWKKVYENLEEGNIFDLIALNENNVIAVVNGMFLLRSNDRGETWQKINLEVLGASGLAVTEEGIVWVVGRKGSFFFSTDYGQTWKRPLDLEQSLINQDWNSIAFDDSGRGIAVGKNGAVAVTYDDGKSWSSVKTNLTISWSKIKMNAGKGLIIGNGRIYKIILKK